ncbi:MAG: helix-turn-helix domain-containing protein [Bifidobacteriaceae bacterium]|nr:helix-turn-helix domain-containing protein [Bifidobacteriaceae bacterium]
MSRRVMRIRTMAQAGQAIREARLEAGLTQEKLAAKAGVSRSWLAQVEAGKPSIDLRKVLQAFESLGITLEAVRDE